MPLLAGQGMATHGLHKNAPVRANLAMAMAGVKSAHRRPVALLREQLQLVARHPAQLSPHGHARHTDGLKLADTPVRCPGVHTAVACARFLHVACIRGAEVHCDLLAIHHVLVLGQCQVAHALGDVLRHIASGAALHHALDVHAVCLRAAFVAVFAQPVMAHLFFNGQRPGFVLGPDQRMPVRRGVVVRLGHAQAVHLYALARQRGPRLGPHIAQPHLTVAGGGARILLVGHRAATAAHLHRVEPAGQRQGKEQAHMRPGVGVFLRTAYARHQFTTAHDGVGRAQLCQLAQRVDLARFIAVQRAAQRLGIALHLRLAARQPVMAHIPTQAHMHTAHANIAALHHTRHMHAQALAPPSGILRPLDGGFARYGLILHNAHAPHQQADAVHPLGQARALAHRQRV